jgi:hypothetical protein
MAKVNAFGLPRPQRKVETRSFEDAVSGATLTLTLRAPDASEQCRASEAAAELIRDFIKGDDVRAAGDFPDLEVKVSETFFRTVATIAEMQCPEDPGDRYTPTELAIIACRMPFAWAQAQAWSNELFRGGADAWGKASPEVPTASSAEPRSSTPVNTP